MATEQTNLTKGFKVTNLSDKEKSDLVTQLQESRFSSKKFLTTAEASIVSGIRKDKLRELGRMGKIGSQDSTGKWQFTRGDLVAFAKVYNASGSRGKNKPVRMLMNVPRNRVEFLVDTLMKSGLYNEINLKYYNLQKNMPALSVFERRSTYQKDSK